MDFYTLSVLVFAAIIALIFYRDRKNVKRESILLLRRTVALEFMASDLNVLFVK